METASQVDTQLLLPNYTRPTHIQQQISTKETHLWYEPLSGIYSHFITGENIRKPLKCRHLLLADQFLKKSIFVRLIFEWIYFRAYKFGNILRRFIFVDSEIVSVWTYFYDHQTHYFFSYFNLVERETHRKIVITSNADHAE